MELFAYDKMTTYQAKSNKVVIKWYNLLVRLNMIVSNAYAYYDADDMLYQILC